MPAITPTSTNPNVTLFNDWYFRTVFNDNLQSRILANYIQSVLGFGSVATVYLPDAYASTLNRTFALTAAEIGLDLSAQFPIRDEPTEEELAGVADQLARERAEAIVLILRPPQAEPLVELLRQRGVTAQLIGTDSLALAGFATEQSEDAEEVSAHFTDGMYIAVPFIPDTATAAARQFLRDYEARYGEDPSWGAIYAYDSALVIIEALQRMQTPYENAEIDVAREAVRREVAAMTSPSRGVVGLMGLTYFDGNGDVLRPIYISRTEGRHVEAAARQLQLIQNVDLIETLRSQGENIIDLGDALLQVTQVVQTGVQLNRVYEINEVDKTFGADFELWFRYSGSLDVSGIVFPDAVTPIVLSKPLTRRSIGGETYEAYRIKALFRYASTRDNLLLGREDFILRFFHAGRDRSRLVFVADSAAMGFAEGQPVWAEQLRQENVLAPESGWVVTDAAIFTETMNRSTMGDPLFPVLNLPYSIFNVGVQAHEAEISLRRQLENLLPQTTTWLPLAVFGIAFVVAGLPGIRDHHPQSSLIMRLILGTILLYIAERVFGVYAAHALELYQLELVLLVFKSLWWLVPAIWAMAILPLLVWQPMERRTGYPVPSVAKTFVNLAIIILAGLCIMSFVFEQPLTSVWAASGVLTLILGLALQSFILDAFSGLMLNLERPFGIGQWIKLTSRWHVTELGRVTELNWRTTRIWTRDNNFVVVPNSSISTSILTNYSVPTRPSRLEIPVLLEFKLPVKEAIRILNDGADKAVAEEGILNDPEPKVVVDQIDPYGVRYKVQIYHDMDAISPDDARTRVVATLLSELQAEGVRIAIPTEQITISSHDDQPQTEGFHPPHAILAPGSQT
ncbi:MAG: ABC transporter substrate-binding protein [Pseudomonadota bacterium]